MIRIFQYLEYLWLWALCALIKLLPFSWAKTAARCAGVILYHAASKRRRAIALENLKGVFGSEKSDKEIREIAIASFVNLALLGVEFVSIPKIIKRLDRFLCFEHAEIAWKALREKKGFIFIVSHFGNWEWMAIASAAAGLPMNAIARPLRNPFVYEYIKKLRGVTGLKSIDKKGASRGAIQALNQNEIVAVLIDQHEREGSIRVPFFGKEAWTTALPAVLAVKKDVPVIPVFFYREQDKPSRVVVKEPFRTIRTGDYERDVYENTKQYLQAIEAEIRVRPGDWLWMHRRWR